MMRFRTACRRPRHPRMGRAIVTVGVVRVIRVSLPVACACQWEDGEGLVHRHGQRSGDIAIRRRHRAVPEAESGHDEEATDTTVVLHRGLEKGRGGGLRGVAENLVCVCSRSSGRINRR